MAPAAPPEDPRAILNILEDLSAEKARLESAQHATFNILEDFYHEKAWLQQTQQAVFNMLEDSSKEKTRSTEMQHAILNIMADISEEKSWLKKNQRALSNILEDSTGLNTSLQESLATSETALKDVAEHKFALDQAAIVATTDVRGTITYVNDKFCGISQYSRHELIGKNHRILDSGNHPREFFQEMYRTIAKGQVWRGEICDRAKDSSTYWIHTTIVPFLNGEGKPRQYVTICADITEKKKAEQEIGRLNAELEQRVLQRTAQLEIANRELESFSYSVSHDLRAPLRHIGGFSKILTEEFGPSLDPQAQKYLQRVQDGVIRMGQLVDELLNLARVGRHELSLRNTALTPIIHDVIAILKAECEGRQIEWKIASLPSMSCDPVLVRQVFQNLIANAVKFTRARERAIIEISHAEENGQTVISIGDNGIGFDMKYRDKLFGVFQRLHRPEDYEGTGIGLATVQRIVQKHGGGVWANAELNKGATFCFTLGPQGQIASTDEVAIQRGRV